MNEKNYDMNGLMDKTIDIPPIAVTYNLDNKIIEDYVRHYLEVTGIDGIAEVKLTVRNEGRANPYVALYLFLNKRSNAIERTDEHIPILLKNKIDRVNIRLNENFMDKITTLCGSDIQSGKAEGSDYYVKLNIFRVLGLMLSVDPHKHSLVITAAKKLYKNNSVISVVKESNYTYSRNSDNPDRYSRQIDNIEKRRK